MTASTLTAERLREVLDYERLTGIFRWKIAESNRVRVGQIAGSITEIGYRRITVNGRRYQAHRLAWLYVTGYWPVDETDHRNGCKDDNGFKNLREASHSENQQNQRRAQIHSKTGLLGVSKRGRTFQSRIATGDKRHNLGSFETAELAHAAYVDAKRRLHLTGTL